MDENICHKIDIIVTSDIFKIDFWLTGVCATNQPEARSENSCQLTGILTWRFLYDNRPIFNEFTTLVKRGTKISVLVKLVFVYCISK